MHENALQIRLETLGDKHTSVANTYSTLGVILVKQRQYEEGRIMHDRALRIRLETLGGKHLSVASSYHCLGVVLEKQGEYKKAEKMHKRALEIRSEILGEDHSTVSTSSKRLQFVLEKQEDDENRSSEFKGPASMIRSTVAASYNCFRSVLKKPKQLPKEASIIQLNGRRPSAE
jgi:tetratricopeptide (TPR) repeat protein